MRTSQATAAASGRRSQANSDAGTEITQARAASAEPGATAQSMARLRRSAGLEKPGAAGTIFAAAPEAAAWSSVSRPALYP